MVFGLLWGVCVRVCFCFAVGFWGLAKFWLVVFLLFEEFAVVFLGWFFMGGGCFWSGAVFLN